MVQTDILMNFQNECAKSENHFNAFGLAKYSGFMGDAVRASYRIPDDMNCVEAAGEFMQFFFWQHDSGQEKMACPSWFAALDDRNL